MNRSFLLSIIIFFLVSINLQAQKNPDSYKKGYQFSVKINNATDTILYFGHYFGNQQYAIDTAYFDKKGIFKFKNISKEMFPGMYFFATPGGKYFEIFIDPLKENIDFEMETDFDQISQKMKIKGSVQNQLFYEHSKYNQKIYAQLDSLKNTGLSDEELQPFREKFVNLIDSNKVLFMEKNPEHFLAKILTATREIDVPPFPRDENGDVLDSAFQYKYYREHYFDNVPLDWDGLVRTPPSVFYERLDKYFEHVLKYSPPDTIIFYADKVIEKARPSKEVFKYIIWYLTDKYLKSSILGYDAVYVYMVERYYMTGEAFWASPSAIEEEGKRAMKWKQLLIGKSAPELITKDLNGNFVSLHQIPNKFTILVFWSPDCGHCKTEIPKLYKFYTENRSKYDIEVYAVNIEFTEDDKWKEFLKKNELDLWINTSGGEANIDWREVYDVYKTPVIYLLDQNKKISGKQLSLESLELIIKDLSEGKKLF